MASAMRQKLGVGVVGVLTLLLLLLLHGLRPAQQQNALQEDTALPACTPAISLDMCPCDDVRDVETDKERDATVTELPHSSAISSSYTYFGIELFQQLNDKWIKHPMNDRRFIRPYPKYLNRPDVQNGRRNRRASIMDDPVRKAWEIKDANTRIQTLAAAFNWNDPLRAPGRGTRMLEVGCGSGHVSEAMMQKYPGVKVVCVEPVSRRDWWVGRKGPDYKVLDLSTADLAREFQPIAQFDFLYSFVVYEHVRDPEAMIKASHRLLKPGGRMYTYANLQRGSSASHLYRDIFFPWPHLLFPPHVFALYYRDVLKREPTIPSWVNGWTTAHYRLAYAETGFHVDDFSVMESRWDDDVDAFYQQFVSILSMYPKKDLKADFFKSVVTKL